MGGDPSLVASDIVRLRKIIKFEDAGADGERHLDALAALGKFTMTVDLLKKTGIGKAVGKLSRKASNPKVKETATKLVNSWRAAVKKKTPQPAPPAPDTGVTPVAREHASAPAAPVGAAPAPEPAAPSRASESAPTTGIRARVYAALVKVFAADDKGNAAERAAVTVEAAMYEKFESEKQEGYKSKFRSLKFNLKNNEVLRADVLSGTVLPADLIAMSEAELATKERQQARTVATSNKFDGARSDFMIAKAEQINKMAGIKKAGGVFKCGKCKSDKSTYYQQQTRSADEPMTVFITCTMCGNRWRQ